MNQISPNAKFEPRELVLWTSTDCNLRCRYCYASGGENPEYMEWETARRAIDIMRGQSDDFNVQFAGGEPLLNLGLIERIIDYAGNSGISYRLQTNATLINAGIAVRLKKLGIAVGVSLDGLPEINDRLRPFRDGCGSTIAAILGLENLRAEGIRVGLTCVISGENIAGLPAFIELSSYLRNVEGVSLDFLRLTGRAAEGEVGQANATLAAKSVSTAVKRADALALLGGGKVSFREVKRMEYLLANNIKRRHRCYFDAGQSVMVKPDGDAYPCASLANFPEFYLGNVMDEDFAEKLPSALESVASLVEPPLRCLECPDYGLCGGPCPAQVYSNRNPDDEIIPTECAVKKVLIDYVKKKAGTSHAPAI